MGMIGEVQDYVALRPHKVRCELCGDGIVVGQAARRWTWKDDVLATIRVHRACDEEAAKCEWYADPDGWPGLYPLKTERAERGRV